MLVLSFALIGSPSQASPEREDQLAAEEFARALSVEFSLAQAAGSDLSKINGVRTAIEQLKKGCEGRGPYSQLVFKVAPEKPAIEKIAANFLTFDHRVLNYHQPIVYSAAWDKGYLVKQDSPTKNSLGDLLAERAASSYVRIYGAARAAGANLTSATDIDSAVDLLEKGVYGCGSFAKTLYKATPPQRSIRFVAKKKLRFHNGSLHYIKNKEKKTDREIILSVEEDLPAQLAQQIAALYNTARAGGADFGKAVTLDRIITALRLGIHSNNDNGVRFFRISTTGSAAEWRRAAAYLRLENGALRYAPPTRKR